MIVNFVKKVIEAAKTSQRSGHGHLDRCLQPVMKGRNEDRARADSQQSGKCARETADGGLLKAVSADVVGLRFCGDPVVWWQTFDDHASGDQGKDEADSQVQPGFMLAQDPEEEGKGNGGNGACCDDRDQRPKAQVALAIMTKTAAGGGAEHRHDTRTRRMGGG